ncbi:MAG TPA: hypothetical protein ENJ37_02595 [Deltaproteobacteria bacterium]|nr:hypothetical protein [Deltaproteobacteria bacterium]
MLALFGGLMAIAVLYSGATIEKHRVRSAARSIYSDMQLARMRALKEGKQWAVEFSGSTYSVKNSGADATWGNSDDQVQRVADVADDFPGVSIDTSTITNSREIFYPDGTATGGRVTLSTTSLTQSLCINSITGNLMIVDGTSC